MTRWIDSSVWLAAAVVFSAVGGVVWGVHRSVPGIHSQHMSYLGDLLFVLAVASAVVAYEKRGKECEHRASEQQRVRIELAGGLEAYHEQQLQRAIEFRRAAEKTRNN